MAGAGYGKELHTLPGPTSKGNEIKSPAINLDGKGGKRGAGKSGHATHSAHGHSPKGASHMAGKRR